MGEYKKLWWTLIGVLAVAFALLGWMGKEVYNQAPPIPQQVATTSGKVLMTHEDILKGQSAWQSAGGMTVGSIWGHGAYQAPDWTADWLHRELTAWLDLAAQDLAGVPYAQLDGDSQRVLQHRLEQEYRKNTFDPATGTVTVSERRARAMAQTASYYDKLFGDEPALRSSRESFAMKEDTLPGAQARAYLGDFFFWTAWAAATERPGMSATYTNNWPHEPLIGNTPTPENVMWSIISVVVLIAGVGLLVWGWAFIHRDHAEEPAPARDPILQMRLTPSQRALGKYLFLVVALFTAQVFIGGFTAHYTVEGQTFYGINVSQWLPYSLVRTWHIQAALFWIATGFLAAGLFLAPIINGGKDPKFQKLGVDILFWALILVVVGSFSGNFLAIAHLMPAEWNFWLGHQGYEYVELGRLWQIGKFLGVAFWLFLMLRGIVPAFKAKGDKNLLALFSASVIAIGLFYAAGLSYGEHTHLSVMEYWRWWVVHLWVEQSFEFFAASVSAYLLMAVGLVSRKLAERAVYFELILIFLGGVIGTGHHLYWAGGPSMWVPMGSMFSFIEVLPLVLLIIEAITQYRLIRAHAAFNYRLAYTYVIGAAFWNFVGAGVFGGGTLNAPLVNYYEHGTFLTLNHAHTALFGAFGLLAIGLVYFCLRYIAGRRGRFEEKAGLWAFWLYNGGLVLWILLNFFPIGWPQLIAVYEHGFAYARSVAFYDQTLIWQWMRLPGDIVFAAGALLMAWDFIVKLGPLYPRLATWAGGRPRVEPAREPAE